MATAAFSSDESFCLDRQAFDSIVYDVNDFPFEDQFEIHNTAHWISSHGFKKVCLQFPDALLRYSARVYEEVKSVVECDLYILGDTSYSNCCIDEVAAAHVSAEGIVHYGHSCFPGSKLPVKYVLPKKKLDLHRILKMIEKELGLNEKICLFYDSCYHYCLDEMQKRWFSSFPESYIAQISTEKSLQTVMGRIIVDCESRRVDVNLMADCICVYVGDRGQTSFNCTVSIKASKWLHFDIDEGKLNELNETQWFKRRRYLIESCKDAQTVGILVCKTSGSAVGDIIKRIKNLCKVTEKKSYIISVGKPNVPKLANFAEIDIYVMIACPENDLYSSRDFFKPIVYPYEFELACNPNREQYPTNHLTDFEDLLPGNRGFCEIEGEIKEHDFSLITGKLRNSNLVSTTVSSQLAVKTNTALEEIGKNLSQRSWSGLDQKLGETEVRKAEVGRSGIAIGYSEEPK